MTKGFSERAWREMPAPGTSCLMRTGPKRKAQKCVFVVSHPRSGTHLTLDFIRRNFPPFNRPLKPWQSSSHFVVSLESPGWELNIELQMRSYSHFLLKSHFAGFMRDVELDAIRKLDPNHTIFIYPFRQFSKTIKSFAEFSQHRGSIADFLFEQDRFFGRNAMVHDCVTEHGLHWLHRDAIFLDIDRLISNPNEACEVLAECLGEKSIEVKRRLPRQKRLYGKYSELYERLTGRESTEVKVMHKKQWKNIDEELAVSNHFSALYAELSKRSINRGD
jgi:hypothetical protein